MSQRKKIIYLLSILIMILGIIIYPLNVFAAQAKSGSLTLEHKLGQYINSRMKSEKIPGMSVVVVKDGRVIFQKCFGYADLKSKRKVNGSSLFPLGQNNEAFTALAILRLEQQKKLSLSDSVSKYLPWLKASYERKRNNQITIEELLYHTSGISNQPEYRLYTEKHTLRKIADQLGEIRLINNPGEKYINSPLNYMILEQIIEKASGQTYKSYMKNEILPGLNLSHTRFAGSFDKQKAVKGYITNFSKLQEYDIKGIHENIKTEEIYSDIADMGKWLEANLNGSDMVFNKLHQPDFYSNGKSGTFRAMGWNSNQDRKNWLLSTGALPNYSSFLGINTKDRLGIGMLLNRNTADIEPFGTGIINILNNEEPWKSSGDTYQQLDKISVIAIWFSIPLIIIFAFFLCFSLLQFIGKKRRFTGFSFKSTATLVMSLTFLCGLIVCLDQIYYILIGPVTKGYIDVWMPKSLVIGMRLFKY
ncbi:MAG TPA: serine hydrolase domain-containing protein, partial [Clostridia bacterium]|nr:serine hydrolase domain-containing protein [Clostridia bacterium]